MVSTRKSKHQNKKPLSHLIESLNHFVIGAINQATKDEN